MTFSKHLKWEIEQNYSILTKSQMNSCTYLSYCSARKIAKCLTPPSKNFLAEFFFFFF